MNRYFNNPPSADPDRVVSHSTIQNHREPPANVVFAPIKESSKDSPNWFEAEETSDKSIELAETDVSDLESENDHKLKNSPLKDKPHKIIPSQQTRHSSSSGESTRNRNFLGNINITSKININLKIVISMKNLSDSSDLNEFSDSLPTPLNQSTKNSSQKVTQSSNKKPNLVQKEKKC